MQLAKWRSPRRWVPVVAGAVLAAALVPLALPAGAAVTRYEAENATISQATVATNHLGFSGTGFVDYNNVTGSYVQWSVNSSGAGTASITVRYANGSTVDRPMDIAVNGVVVSGSLSFPPTANWDTWASKTITVPVSAGANTVRATATTVNGGPNVDYLDVTVAVPSTVYQAENATIVDGTVASNHLNFTGTGFVDYASVVGSYVQWSVSVASAGTVPVVLRYANGSTANRPMDIAVNGGVVAAGVSFPPTTNWDTWADATINVPLTGGVNTIRATATTVNGGPNVDKLTVPGASGTGGSSSPPPSPSPSPLSSPSPTAPPSPSPTASASPSPSVSTSVSPSISPSSTPTAGASMAVAPYEYLGWGSPQSPTDVMSSTGIKFFTLAFILSDGSCNPAWDGSRPLTGGDDQAKINSIRGAGGDVVVSFGGASGAKLGENCSSASALAGAYQKVISAYGLKAIDIDIEATEASDATVRQRVIDALKIVRSNNPGIEEYMTFGTTLSGPEPEGIDLINKGAAAGLTIDGWTIMPFDFGGHSGTMGDATISAVQGLEAAVKRAYGYSDTVAYAHIGISSMNGKTDESDEIVSLTDFQTILAYAQQHHIARLTFWSINRDRSCTTGLDADSCSGVSQSAYAYTKVFVQYTG